MHKNVWLKLIVLMLEFVWSLTLLRFFGCWLYKYVRAISLFELTFGVEIWTYLTWYQSLIKDCNVDIWSMLTLGVKVGVEIDSYDVEVCLKSHIA